MLICYLVLLNLFNILILMPILLELFSIFAPGNSSTKPIIFKIMLFLNFFYDGDGHFLDDPLFVQCVDYDFSNLGIEPINTDLKL